MSADSIIEGLLQALLERKVYWSFEKSGDFQISEEVLIENVLLY